MEKNNKKNCFNYSAVHGRTRRETRKAETSCFHKNKKIIKKNANKGKNIMIGFLSCFLSEHSPQSLYCFPQTLDFISVHCGG